MFCYWKETTSTFKETNAFRLVFTSFMLLKQLLNNLLICLEGLLNCIWKHVTTKVNVFMQKNAYYIRNYVHKSMENCLLRDKYSFSSKVLSRILLSFVENFKNGVAYKTLTCKTVANSNLNAGQSNFLVY